MEKGVSFEWNLWQRGRALGGVCEKSGILEFLVSCQVANPGEAVAKFQCNISQTISRLKVQRTENLPWHPPVALLTNRAKLIVGKASSEPDFIQNYFL